MSCSFWDEELLDYPVSALQKLGLSARENEVLAWMARGTTNGEIAAILSISARTVQKHLEHIYARVGIENRHAAIALAMEAALGKRSSR